MQLLVNTSNGHIGHVELDDTRTDFGTRVRWPVWVRLIVGEDVREAIAAAANADTGKTYASLDAFSDEQIALLSIDDVISVKAAELVLVPVPTSQAKLASATDPEREGERVAYEHFVTLEGMRQEQQARPEKLRRMGRRKAAKALEQEQQGSVAIMLSEELRALSLLNQAAAANKARGAAVAENLREQVRSRGR